MHIFLQGDRDSLLVTGFEQDQRCVLKVLVEGTGNMAAPDISALVLDQERSIAGRHLFQQRNRQRVLEIDLRWLWLWMIAER